MPQSVVCASVGAGRSYPGVLCRALDSVVVMWGRVEPRNSLGRPGPGTAEVVVKGVLEFSFPEDEVKHRHAVNAGNYYWALERLAEMYRNHEKYDGPAVTRRDFFEVLAEYGIELGVE